MNKKVHFFWGIALLTLTSCSREQTSSGVQAGRSHFIGYGCNTCHQVNGQGGVLGPDLTFIGFRKTPEWLDLWLQNPHGWKKNTQMPNFFLKEHVRQALVQYLSSLKGGSYRQEPPWNAPELMTDPIKRGEKIFRDVGCQGCHGVSGKGGYPNNNVVGGLIPPLTSVADGFSKEELKDKIRKGSNPAPADSSQPDPMISMPEWGQVLKEDELDALVEYLYSLRPPHSSEEWE